MSHNKKPYEMLVKQIANEYGNYFFYLSIANHYENLNYKGFAKYYKHSAEEELEHANKIMAYLWKKQYYFTIPTPNIREMPDNMTDLAIAEARLELEEQTSKEWTEIFETAKGKYGLVPKNGKMSYQEVEACEPSVTQDIATDFIKIQDDEVAEANEFIAKIKMTTNLLILDKELQG